MEYDFGGWATKNDIKCSDGRTIRKDAFAHNDGKTVPLVWNHNHNDPTNILGYALLENRPEGVYTYGKFNDTEYGQQAKALVQHGDIKSLSIFANRLKQTKNKDVLHGQIREVSLVLAGANNGATIEDVVMHEDGNDESFVYYVGEDNCSFLEHAEKPEEEPEEKQETKEETKKEENPKMKEKKVKDVLDTFNEEQTQVLNFIVGQALEDAGVEVDDEGNIVKHNDEGEYEEMNVFDQNLKQNKNVLTHADEENIVQMAKECGSFQKALQYFAEDNELAHDDVASAVGGFNQVADTNGYSIETLFPDYKEVRPGAPELITNDQGWISVVMQKVHKSPISRIRTSQVDIRNIDALRAKGYKKGNKKAVTGNFNLVRRTTDPQTIYVKNALHRDDIIDITEFDYVSYLYGIDRMMLNEELATAIMLGDGREEAAEDKIDPTHIRPIWLDDDLYTLHVDLDIEGAKTELQGTNTGASFGENYITAEAMINTVLYAREKFKGTGTPDYFCTPHMLNVMLLARDMNGRRIYSSKAELASALNVGNIYTAEQFAGKTRKDGEGKTKKLAGIICNLADYSLGATKGGEVTHFTQFDIDFNQQKSLLETRCSGALTRVFSAIAIEEPAEEAQG